MSFILRQTVEANILYVIHHSYQAFFFTYSYPTTPFSLKDYFSVIILVGAHRKNATGMCQTAVAFSLESCLFSYNKM